jgi:hypothetical protein
MTTATTQVSAEQETWEARTEADIGMLIHSYLLTHPAPGRSEVADNLEDAAARLVNAGVINLDRLGQPRLRIAGGDA